MNAAAPLESTIMTRPVSSTIEHHQAQDAWGSLKRSSIGGALLAGPLLVEGAGIVHRYTIEALLAVGTCVAAAVVAFTARGAHNAGRRPIVGKPWYLLVALFGLTWIARFILDFHDMDLFGYGIKLGISYLTMLVVIAILCRGRYFRSVQEVCLAIVLGIAIYGAANLAAQVIGITPGRSEEQIERFRSRFEYVDFRWLPPLANSNGAFSMLNIFGLGLALRVPFFSRGRLRVLSSAVVLLAVVVLGVCAVLVQFRGTMLIILMSIVWILVGRDRWRMVVDAVCLVGMVTVPFLFIHLYGCNLLEELLPRRVVALLGTNPESVYTLSGRAYFYNYGFDCLHDPATLWLGDGPGKRDATPGLMEAGLPELGVTIGFHQSFLDMIIPHGVIASSIVFAAIGRLLWLCLFALRRRPRERRIVRPIYVGALAPIGVVASGSWIDGPFGYFPILFLALLPAFSWILPMATSAPKHCQPRESANGDLVKTDALPIAAAAT